MKNTHPNSLAQLRKFLQKKYPLIDIARGSGYYYFYSEDAETSIQLNKNPSTSVYVFNCKELSFEQWMRDLDEMLSYKD